MPTKAKFHQPLAGLDNLAKHVGKSQQRPTAHKRGYTNRWQRFRRWYLRRNPLCKQCGAVATVIDHITPHKGNRELFWDTLNMQPLCKQCHDKKTALHDGAFGRNPSG